MVALTKGERILSNNDFLAAQTTISPNSAEEADQKLVRIALQCVQSGIDHAEAKTILQYLELYIFETILSILYQSICKANL